MGLSNRNYVSFIRYLMSADPSVLTNQLWVAGRLARIRGVNLLHDRPILYVMYMQILGKRHLVWDQSASIR